MTIITLVTDFGLDDTYVGQLKGAILGVAAGVTVVDLTHTVAAQDVMAGAFLLWSAVEVFPAGTIHLAVIDPGVGSARRAIAIGSMRGDIFVGPDNGVLVPAVERLGGVDLAVELSERRYWRLQAASNTFHGRDVFGPVAGHIATGVPLAQLGRAVHDVVRRVLPQPRGLEGEVLHIDTYGNLITNLPSSSLPPGFQTRLLNQFVPTATHYAAVEPGALVALVGSAGLLEISARDASAARVTGAGRGTPVSVEPL